MLRITQNSTSKLYVTLQDKVINIGATNFTWRLFDKETLKYYYFYNDNTSNSPYYDSFTLSVGGTYSNPAQGVVQCPHGQYTYEIYEMTSADLNINNAVGMIETGILLISPTYSTTISATNSNTISVNKNLDRI